MKFDTKDIIPDLTSQIVVTHNRLASKANVMELEDFILTLARLMPPQTSLRQALAFLMIGRMSVSGETVTAARLSRIAGDDVQRAAIFGPAFRRTLKPLIAMGLVLERASEDDLRANDLTLTPDGLALLRQAMDAVS